MRKPKGKWVNRWVSMGTRSVFAGKVKFGKVRIMAIWEPDDGEEGAPQSPEKEA